VVPGDEFFTALRRLNKPVWMLTYNDEQHNLTKRKKHERPFHSHDAVLRYYLKDAPMPYGWPKDSGGQERKDDGV